MQPAGQRHGPKHGDLARPEHGMARSYPCPCRPEAHSVSCFDRLLGPLGGTARPAFNSRHGVGPVLGNLWNLKYQVLWLVKLVTFGKWNMICGILYYVNCEVSMSLNVIYLCFVDFCIKFGVFYNGPWAGPKHYQASCFLGWPDSKIVPHAVPGPSGRHGGLWRHGMARWHAGHTSSCSIGPCLARAHAGSDRADPLLIFRETKEFWRIGMS